MKFFFSEMFFDPQKVSFLLPNLVTKDFLTFSQSVVLTKFRNYMNLLTVGFGITFHLMNKLFSEHIDPIIYNWFSFKIEHY